MEAVPIKVVITIIEATVLEDSLPKIPGRTLAPPIAAGFLLIKSVYAVKP